MPDDPKVHTGQPLVPISDDDIAYRAKVPHWTMTEAVFLLSGYKPPGYESTRHMQDHFWGAYHVTVQAIEMGNICRKIERAGERVFIDSPARWFAWADNLGPKYIKVDERVRRAFRAAPNKGGRRPAMSSRSSDVYQFFDEIVLNEKPKFCRGELTAIAQRIADKTGYKMDSVRKMIGPSYRRSKIKSQKEPD